MVRDPGALRRAPVRISGPVVGGDEKATPGATSRPPLRAIQPPASGGPRWSLPTARKVLGVREGKAPARVGAVSTSVAPRKQGPKLVGRSRLTTAGTSSMDEPCNKVRDAISFWEQNSSNVQNVSSTMWQYDSHAPAKVEDCSDEDFIKISEDVLKMHLELDIFKTILVEEKAAHAEVIDDLESDLVISIKESRELKKSNDQSLELLQKRDMEISRLNSELDICHKQEYLANEEPKMQTLKFYDAEASPLSTKLKRMQASLEKARNLNTRYQQDQASRSSAEQEKDEVRRQAEVETSEVILTLQQQLDASKQNELLTRENLDVLQLEKNQLSDRLAEVMKENEHFSSVIEELSTNNSLLQSKLMRSNELANALSLDLRIVQESTSIAKDKADELTKVKASVILLERALSSKCLELEDVISERQQLEAQILKSNEKLAALEELGKQFDELNIVSMENAELKSQLKQIGRISYTAEELAHKSEITGKYEEDLIELRSLQNELSKLPVEKQCCEAQMLIFKRKLEMAQALIAESESIAAKAQQKAENRMAYAEEKEKEVKLLERSIEDLEITVCELENKMNIVKEEAKHERMRREELELKVQNIRQQKLIVPSFGNASCSMEDEMVNLVNSIRQSQDIQKGAMNCPNAYFPYSHALLKTTNRTRPNPYPTVEAREVTVEPAPQIEDPDEPCEEHSLNEDLKEPKQTDAEMAEENSSDDVYLPEISEFEQPNPNEHLEQYSVSGLPELHGVGVDSDQSRSESRSEEQLPPSFVGPMIEIVEENELPPFATMRPNDRVNYMRAPSDELKRLRSRNHYVGPRTATDRRFWSIEQQDLYTSIYSRAKLADMKWIDWPHIDSIDHFAGIRKQCAHLGLGQIMSYCCHWDSELIRQFYSTVHINADKTSITWMTDGRKIIANKRAWEERFSIASGAHTEIHSQLFLNDDDKRMLYTATKYTLGQIRGLSPLASIANKILKTTIYPRFGNATHSWNVLYHIVQQHPFDIISLIFGEIDLLISDHSRTKDPLLYAPYIMGMIMRAFKYEGPRESWHHSYKPRPYYRQKLPRKAHTSAAGATPTVLSPLEASFSAVHPEVAAAGHKAHVEEVDDHHQSETAGYQPQVEAVQRRVKLVQPKTLTYFFQDGLRPRRDTLATMDDRIGIVQDGASVPAQHINISCSSQIPASNSSLAPSLQTTATALPRAPATSHFSEQPSVVHADNPGVSGEPPVHVRPSPFSGFRWYQRK